jgi:hypothetical protein
VVGIFIHCIAKPGSSEKEKPGFAIHIDFSVFLVVVMSLETVPP